MEKIKKITTVAASVAALSAFPCVVHAETTDEVPQIQNSVFENPQSDDIVATIPGQAEALSEAENEYLENKELSDAAGEVADKAEAEYRQAENAFQQAAIDADAAYKDAVEAEKNAQDAFNQIETTAKADIIEAEQAVIDAEKNITYASEKVAQAQDASDEADAVVDTEQQKYQGIKDTNGNVTDADVSEAEQSVSDAGRNLENVNKEVEAAAEAVTKAEADVFHAETEKKITEEVLISAEEAVSQARKEIEQAQSIVDSAQSALENAKKSADSSEYREAENEYQQALALVTEKQNSLVKAREDLELAKKDQREDGKGFFYYLESNLSEEGKVLEKKIGTTLENALAVNASSNYPDDSFYGKKEGFTEADYLMWYNDELSSYDFGNINRALDKIDQYNQIRKNNGLHESYVSLGTMIAATANANGSVIVQGHTFNFPVNENMAITGSQDDAFRYWYDDEKLFAETGTSKYGCNSTGHYYNIIANDNVFTGYGIHQTMRNLVGQFIKDEGIVYDIGLSSGEDTSVQDFKYSVFVNGVKYDFAYVDKLVVKERHELGIYTTDEFRDLIQQYVSNVAEFEKKVSDAEVAFSDAKNTLNEKKTLRDSFSKEVSECEKTLTDAHTVLQAKSGLLAEKQEALMSARIADTSAGTALSDKKQVLTDASEKLREKTNAEAEAKAFFEEAEAILSNIKARREIILTEESALKTAEKNALVAKGILREAEKVLNNAKNEARKANEVLDEANKKLQRFSSVSDYGATIKNYIETGLGVNDEAFSYLNAYLEDVVAARSRAEAAKALLSTMSAARTEAKKYYETASKDYVQKLSVTLISKVRYEELKALADSGTQEKEENINLPASEERTEDAIDIPANVVEEQKNATESDEKKFEQMVHTPAENENEKVTLITAGIPLNTCLIATGDPNNIFMYGWIAAGSIAASLMLMGMIKKEEKNHKNG